MANPQWTCWNLNRSLIINSSSKSPVDYVTNWWIPIFFYVHPENWGRFPPILTIIFFNWVGLLPPTSDQSTHEKKGKRNAKVAYELMFILRVSGLILFLFLMHSFKTSKRSKRGFFKDQFQGKYVTIIPSMGLVYLPT